MRARVCGVGVSLLPLCSTCSFLCRVAGKAGAARLTAPAAVLAAAGDIVVIKSGDKVPADLRLLQTANLQIQEAMLTGESVPVSKTLDAVKPESGLVSIN